MYYKNIKLCLDDTASYLGTIAYDAGPLLTVCVSFLIFMLSSLILLILLQAKEPVLAFIPRFPPLWGYLMSRSGCEPYALRVYLGIVYLPFGVVLSIVIKQYEPVLAAVVYFIYQTVVLFRRLRLMSKCLSVLYNFCSNDLDIKCHALNSCGRFWTTVISIQQVAAAQKFFPLGRDILYTPRPNRDSLAYNQYNGMHDYFRYNLFTSEEFRNLNITTQNKLSNLVDFKFRGVKAHSCGALKADQAPVFVMVPFTSERSGPGFSGGEQKFYSDLVNDVTKIAPELTPLLEPWSKGFKGSQFVVSKGPIVVDMDAAAIDFKIMESSDLPSNFNGKFGESPNIDVLHGTLSPARTFLKELEKSSKYDIGVLDRTINSFNSAHKDVKLFSANGSLNSIKEFIKNNTEL